VHSRGPTVWATSGAGAIETMTGKLNATNKAFPDTIFEISMGFLVGVFLLSSNNQVFRQRE
jgi:hypothetical protein